MNADDVLTVESVMNERFRALCEKYDDRTVTLAVSVYTILQAINVAAHNAEHAAEQDVVKAAIAALILLAASLNGDTAVIRQALRELMAIREDGEKALNNVPDVANVLHNIWSRA